jgi:hypothetical protein
MDLDSLDVKALQLLLNNYEKKLKEVESNGYTWQETYFLTSPITEHIKEISALIEYKSHHKRSLGLSLKPIMGTFSTIFNSHKLRTYFHLH